MAGWSRRRLVQVGLLVETAHREISEGVVRQRIPVLWALKELEGSGRRERRMVESGPG
jgi:hypothetical protein